MGALGGGTCTCAIARAIWCVAAWSPYHSSPHHSTACRTTSSPIAPHHRMSHRIPFLSGSVAPHHSSWSPPQFMVPPTPACISWWGAVICMRWSATTAPAPLPDPFPRACPLPPTPCPLPPALALLCIMSSCMDGCLVIGSSAKGLSISGREEIVL